MDIQSTLLRLSLVNQWRLDRGRLLFFLFIFVFFSLLIIYVIPEFTEGNILGGVVGLICGLTINLWFTCIARLCISSAEDKPQVSSILEKYGYSITDEGFYDLSVHRLRKFRSQRVLIEEKNGGLVITGPFNILKKITKQLTDKASST